MTHDEIRAIVREVLAEVLAPLLGQHQEPKTDEWRDITDAWEPLGYPSYHACRGPFRAESSEWARNYAIGAKMARSKPNRKSI